LCLSSSLLLVVSFCVCIFVNILFLYKNIYAGNYFYIRKHTFDVTIAIKFTLNDPRWWTAHLIFFYQNT
jgi:cell shape-determining protein MreC